MLETWNEKKKPRLLHIQWTISKIAKTPVLILKDENQNTTDILPSIHRVGAVYLNLLILGNYIIIHILDWNTKHNRIPSFFFQDSVSNLYPKLSNQSI